MYHHLHSSCWPIQALYIIQCKYSSRCRVITFTIMQAMTVAPLNREKGTLPWLYITNDNAYAMQCNCVHFVRYDYLIITKNITDYITTAWRHILLFSHCTFTVCLIFLPFGFPPYFFCLHYTLIPHVTCHHLPSTLYYLYSKVSLCRSLLGLNQVSCQLAFPQDFQSWSNDH